MIRFFAYTGSKFRFVNKINSYINSSKKDVYIEPFFGSGAVFFNLRKKFKKYIINDLNENLVGMYKSFREIEFQDYINAFKFVNKEFGDIKQNKESYYNFRNWFNRTYWKTKTIEEGIYLHFLTNSCLNSFLRFGPNGMNGCFGNRLYLLNKDSFLLIKNKLIETEIYSCDYKDIMKTEDAFYFLDPPYFQSSTSYENGFKENDLLEFINIIKSKEYVYTDVLNEHNIVLNYEKIREMRNTSPNRNSEREGKMECIFYSDNLHKNTFYKKFMEKSK